ncbi:MAG: phosphoribosyltransferase family protein [Methanobacteriaceae archaeon]
MNRSIPGLVDLSELRDRIRVFRDREEAGQVLSGMLTEFRDSDSLILAIPSGGVPVGIVLAQKLHLKLDVAVTSKITIPWNPEAGYGAVAFDGTVVLNQGLIKQLGLGEETVNQGLNQTREKVKRRIQKFRDNNGELDIRDKTVILTDDGVASGYTLLAALRALKNQEVKDRIVATPTAHREALAMLKDDFDAVYCPNLRSGWGFAVAEAYHYWYDVDEDEAVEMLESYSRVSENRPGI